MPSPSGSSAGCAADACATTTWCARSTGTGTAPCSSGASTPTSGGPPTTSSARQRPDSEGVVGRVVAQQAGQRSKPQPQQDLQSYVPHPPGHFTEDAQPIASRRPPRPEERQRPDPPLVAQVSRRQHVPQDAEGHADRGEAVVHQHRRSVGKVHPPPEIVGERPVVVLTVDVEKVEVPRPRRSGPGRVLLHELHRVTDSRRRDGALEVVAGATAAEQPSLDEGIDGDEVPSPFLEGCGEHDRRAPAVAADLDGRRPGGQRARLLVQQGGLTVGQPAGDAVGDGPYGAEAFIGRGRHGFGHWKSNQTRNGHGSRGRRGARRAVGAYSAGQGAPATTSLMQIPPVATSVTRTLTCSCRPVTTKVA